MKIRIMANSVRFRLNRMDVATLCRKGRIKEVTNFDSHDFVYSVTSAKVEHLAIDFLKNEICLRVSQHLLSDWENNNTVGFYATLNTPQGKSLNLTIEKDFACLDDRDEDETQNYPNPKAQQSING